ncbi:hypothetical protein QTO34_004007 [Cnephaeus nilssonii]|uniref:Uncharacterized protein n=1 Tax=Cnephaeus nilssonii TaxID=3371016 RepID=A0AA40HRX7_CNENI|nr:hypothetical protein QTO34_004007 [Eptesicus nilssonii]
MDPYPRKQAMVLPALLSPVTALMCPIASQVQFSWTQYLPNQRNHVELVAQAMQELCQHCPGPNWGPVLALLTFTGFLLERQWPCQMWALKEWGATIDKDCQSLVKCLRTLQGSEWIQEEPLVMCLNTWNGSGLGPRRWPWAWPHPASLLRIAGADPQWFPAICAGSPLVPKAGKASARGFPGLGLCHTPTSLQWFPGGRGLVGGHGLGVAKVQLSWTQYLPNQRNHVELVAQAMQELCQHCPGPNWGPGLVLLTFTGFLLERQRPCYTWALKECGATIDKDLQSLVKCLQILQGSEWIQEERLVMSLSTWNGAVPSEAPGLRVDPGGALGDVSEHLECCPLLLIHLQEHLNRLVMTHCLETAPEACHCPGLLCRPVTAVMCRIASQVQLSWTQYLPNQRNHVELVAQAMQELCQHCPGPNWGQCWRS